MNAVENIFLFFFNYFFLRFCFPILDLDHFDRSDFTLALEEFTCVIENIKASFRGPAALDPYFGGKKLGTYVLITASGVVYGTTDSIQDGFYPMVGPLLEEHLCSIAERIPFSAVNHNERYGGIIQASG